MASEGVTVGIPVYNGSPWIAQCLDSIRSQTATPTEVLVIDDASTDDSVQRVRAFARDLPLRFLRNPRRCGIAATSNRLVAEARCEWVKFVYQDDSIESRCLERLSIWFESGGPALVVCGRRYEFVGEIPDAQRDGCRELIKRSIASDAAEGMLRPVELLERALDAPPLVNIVGEPVAFAVRREDYLRCGGMDRRLRHLLDYDLALRLGLDGGVTIVSDVLAAFRLHADAATARNLSPRRSYASNVLEPAAIWLKVSSEARSLGFPPLLVRAARDRANHLFRRSLLELPRRPPASVLGAVGSLARWGFDYRSELVDRLKA